MQRHPWWLSAKAALDWWSFWIYMQCTLHIVPLLSWPSWLWKQYKLARNLTINPLYLLCKGQVPWEGLVSFSQPLVISWILLRWNCCSVWALWVWPTASQQRSLLRSTPEWKGWKKKAVFFTQCNPCFSSNADTVFSTHLPGIEVFHRAHSQSSSAYVSQTQSCKQWPQICNEMNYIISCY